MMVILLFTPCAKDKIVFPDLIFLFGVEPASPSETGIFEYSEYKSLINDAGSPFKYRFFYPYLNEIHHMD